LLRLDFALLQQRAALVTPALTGWKSYPVSLSAQLRDDTLDLRLTVSVAYSSTCPCSAALSRQALQDAFATDFAQHEAIDRDAALGWLARHASVATPHSQRSQAVLSIAVSGDAAQFLFGWTPPAPRPPLSPVRIATLAGLGARDPD
jgi:GTP cyclohydrolase I